MKKTDVQFLTLTLVTLCIVAAVASAAELKTPADRTVWLRDNRGVSLFFDTTLTGWTADELVASLRGIRPEMFVVEAQLIHGAQYPTACKRGAAPGENKDDLARAREVARRLDSKWFAYLPVDSAHQMEYISK
jgi:hypothetical protein